MRIVLLFLLACLLVVPLQAQTDQDRAIQAVISFLEKMGDTPAADKLRSGWGNQITMGATKDNDNAQTSPGTPNIRFNTKMANEIIKGGQVDSRAVADWAATFKHELRHTTQSPTQWAGSYWQNEAGAGHPCEASAWGEGFQAYRNWLETAQSKLAGARSEAERVEAAKLVRDLSDGFREYYNNYPKEYGSIQVDTRDGPMNLAEAAGEADKASASVSRYVKEESFSTGLSPRQTRVKAGATMTFTAMPKGGVPFYTYHWSADGQQLPDTGKSITRTATASETVSVEVWDVRGRKVSASSQVTVEETALSLTLPPSLQVRPGEEFTVEAKVKGGRKPFVFRWTSNGKASSVTSAGLRGKRDQDSTLSVTVEDAAKHTATASCKINVSLEATASPADLEIQPNQPFSLGVQPRGGCPPYTYSWSEGGSTVGTGARYSGKRAADSTFVVEVRDARGQTAQDTCRVKLGVLPRDGVYSGRFRGIGKSSKDKSGTSTNGMMTLQVRGSKVTGRVGGSYGGDPFTGTVVGSIDAQGSLNCTLNGQFSSEGGFTFTGWIRGRIANQVGKGTFGAANSWDTPTGSWEVSWKSP